MNCLYSFSRGRFLFIIVGYRRSFVLRWDISIDAHVPNIGSLTLAIYLDPLNLISAITTLVEVFFVCKDLSRNSMTSSQFCKAHFEGTRGTLNQLVHFQAPNI